MPKNRYLQVPAALFGTDCSTIRMNLFFVDPPIVEWEKQLPK